MPATPTTPAAPAPPPVPPAPVTFDEFVWKQAPRLKLLPLVHNAQCKTFNNIARSGALPLDHCDVFHEDLVYLFYGKAAFIHSHLPGGATDYDSYPICFLFKTRRGGLSISRVFPCDSGALDGGMFSAAMKAARDQYKLRGAIEAAERVVSTFFDSNTDYCNSKATAGAIPADAPSEANHYYSLITTTGHTVYDDRRACVEIQADKPVMLKGYLSHVILPSSFLAQPGVYETIVNDWDATPFGYPTIFGGNPQKYYYKIREKVDQMIIDMGLG